MTLNQVNNGCLAAGLSDTPTAAGITGILTTAFTKDGAKKRENRRVSSGRVEGKGHVDVRGQRSDGADWWETTERQR